MLKRILRFIILLCIFAGGVFLFTGLMNHGATESASDLADPALPVMCIDINGSKADRMYGYTTPINASWQRDALIPMTTGRTVTVSYKANGEKISSVSYEVTAPDTGEVVENAKIGDFRSDGDYMTASFTLTQPILMDREYPIRFTIETGDKEIQYYARLLQRADLNTEKYVKFAYDFYETCTNKSGASGLNTYLETDNTITNDSYTNVNLKSTLDQVTWGTLSPQILRKAVPTIKEISAETCSLTLDYLISAENENKETEVYRVFEFYRLRYYNGRIMVLDFNREATEVFNPENSGAITTDGIFLGVAEKGVTYKSDSTADIVAFIQDNALWEFNSASQKLSRIFTFHNDTADGNELFDNNHYGIRILNVSDGGDVDFVVYGYMNRGAHEGEQGVMVCHYSGEGAYVEEKAFIPCGKSEERIASDLDKVSYLNSNGVYFVYLDRALYRVDLETHTSTVVLKDINPDCFVSSSDHSMAAWADEMQKDSSTSLTVMNLSSDSTRSISADNGCVLRALGFVNDDFIYGTADKADIETLPAGGTLFAMKDVRIISTDGTVVKDYSEDNIWVSDVTLKSNLIELSRVTKAEGGGYTDASTDHIMNNKQTTDKKVTVSAANNTRKGTVITLKLPTTVKNLKPLISKIQIRTVDPAVDVDLDLPSTDTFSLYYVYTYGILSGIYTDPAKAIIAADAGVGVVENQEGQYIYERGNTATENEINNEDIPEAVKSKELNADTLQTSLGDSAQVMNLTGCTLNQVLYEVSEGRCVLTRSSSGDTILIVGYNRYNTRLYNFDTGEHYWMGINDSTAEFEAGGNIFVSYVEPDITVKNAS